MQELDPIEEQFKRIQDSKKQESQKKKVEFDKKNYLDVKLNSGETSKELTIRILKLTPDSETPFAIVHTHYLPSAKKTFICTKQTQGLPVGTDTNCPFCDIKDQAKADQKGSDQATWNKLKEIYKQNSSMLSYIVRVIDRDDENFGIKFWKFSEPVYKMIYNLYKINKKDGIDIFDYEEGKDLVITLEKNDKKTKVVSVIARNRTTPLASTPALANKYITDEKVWKDVYGIKPYDYLEILINGKTPFYDKATNKWVEKKEESDDSEEFDNANENADEFDNSSEDDTPF